MRVRRLPAPTSHPRSSAAGAGDAGRAHGPTGRAVVATAGPDSTVIAPDAPVGAAAGFGDVATNDPAFRADAKKRGMVVNPLKADKIQQVIGTAMATPEPILAKFREMVKLKPKK